MIVFSLWVETYPKEDDIKKNIYFYFMGACIVYPGYIENCTNEVYLIKHIIWLQFKFDKIYALFCVNFVFDD